MNSTKLSLIITVIIMMNFSTFASMPLPNPVTDEDYHDMGNSRQELVQLGQLLFFDKILSGNRNISCATCHHPQHATSDGLALPLGEGPKGLGPRRTSEKTIEVAVHGRVPRNSPALFNLGAKEFRKLFHDGRIEEDPAGYYEGGFITPAKWKLPKGLNTSLAAQAMFPVASPMEMAGQKGENSIADASSLNKAAGPNGVWELLAERLQDIPEYVQLFKVAFPEQISARSDITFVHAANAIAAFQANAFRSDNSPFDNYLRGETENLSDEQLEGMELFYGKAKCSDCHSGKFQTDHEFHAIAMPQIGPGKGDGKDGGYWRASGQRAFLEDFGRGRVTVRSEDNYKFRTPSLRNTAHTGPWGHSGAYDSLDEVVRHHSNPEKFLLAYKTPDKLLPELRDIVEISADGPRITQDWIPESLKEEFFLRDAWVQKSAKLREKIKLANELEPVELTNTEVICLIAFLESLTDPAISHLESIIPSRVPSGLPIID